MKKIIPLILIHGYPFDHRMWEGVSIRLARDCKVHVPDMRGFGGRPVSEAEPSLEIFADDVADFLDERDIPSAVVAGMSMGGYIALAFAERHPKRLAGLGLVATHCFADTEEARKSRYALIERVKRESFKAAAAAIAPNLFAPRNAKRQDLLAGVSIGAEAAGEKGICWALEAMAKRPDRSHVLKSLAVPALIIHGAADGIIPPARAKEMFALIPEGRYIELPDVGHASPQEAPDEVATALSELIEAAGQRKVEG